MQRSKRLPFLGRFTSLMLFESHRRLTATKFYNSLSLEHVAFISNKTLKRCQNCFNGTACTACKELKTARPAHVCFKT